MMKKYIKYMASLLAVSFAMSACIDLEEMNVDPNNATTTNPSLLLTGVAETISSKPFVVYSLPFT